MYMFPIYITPFLYYPVLTISFIVLFCDINVETFSISFAFAMDSHEEVLELEAIHHIVQVKPLMKVKISPTTVQSKDTEQDRTCIKSECYDNVNINPSSPLSNYDRDCRNTYQNTSYIAYISHINDANLVNVYEDIIDLKNTSSYANTEAENRNNLNQNQIEVSFSLEVETSNEFSQDPATKEIYLQVQVDRHQVKPFIFNAKKETIDDISHNLNLYCSEIGINERNCLHIFDSAISILESIACPLPQVCQDKNILRQVCLSVEYYAEQTLIDNESTVNYLSSSSKIKQKQKLSEGGGSTFKECYDIDKWQSIYIGPRPGKYFIHMDLVGKFPGRSILFHDSASIFIFPKRRTHQIKILSPNHGALMNIENDDTNDSFRGEEKIDSRTN